MSGLPISPDRAGYACLPVDRSVEESDSNNMILSSEQFFVLSKKGKYLVSGFHLITKLQKSVHFLKNPNYVADSPAIVPDGSGSIVICHSSVNPGWMKFYL